jgi:hypothetical protein
MIDVVQLVRESRDNFEWAEVKSVHNGYTLYIQVFRDAMKFDGIPALTWDFKEVIGDNRLFHGVRLPASAHQLQEIADLLNCMLLTPKIIDMIWLQAELKFDCIVNVNGNIVAISHIHDVHQAIEKKTQQLGDDGTKLVSCVGKYWCLINDLQGRPKLHGDEVACNYGWCAKSASGPGITPGVQCWQRPGFRHNKLHWDPSQTIRLMHRSARLVHPDGTEEKVDLHDIAANPALAYLIHHQGPLTYLRQKGVNKLDPIVSEPIPTPDPIPNPIPEPEPEPIPDPAPELDPIPEPSKPKGAWQVILAFLMSILALFRRK